MWLKYNMGLLCKYFENSDMSNKGSGFTRKTLPADEITLNAEQIFPGPGSLPINMLGMQSILSKVARKLQNSASLLALI